jgi:hypothetical protein
MVASEKRQLERLERLLAEEMRNEDRAARKGDARMPKAGQG